MSHKKRSMHQLGRSDRFISAVNAGKANVVSDISIQTIFFFFFLNSPLIQVMVCLYDKPGEWHFSECIWSQTTWHYVECYNLQASLAGTFTRSVHIEYVWDNIQHSSIRGKKGCDWVRLVRKFKQLLYFEAYGFYFLQ